MVATIVAQFFKVFEANCTFWIFFTINLLNTSKLVTDLDNYLLTVEHNIWIIRFIMIFYVEDLKSFNNTLITHKYPATRKLIYHYKNEAIYTLFKQPYIQAPSSLWHQLHCCLCEFINLNIPTVVIIEANSRYQHLLSILGGFPGVLAKLNAEISLSRWYASRHQKRF